MCSEGQKTALHGNSKFSGTLRIKYSRTGLRRWVRGLFKALFVDLFNSQRLVVPEGGPTGRVGGHLGTVQQPPIPAVHSSSVGCTVDSNIDGSLMTTSGTQSFAKAAWP